MQGSDQDGKGQGLAMLRLETRRYKCEMQQIRMQRELHDRERSTTKGTVSVTPSGMEIQDESWRFPETITTSQATSSNTLYRNQEEMATPLERLANVEESTQTDHDPKKEVETNTEDVQIGVKETQSIRERTKLPSASEGASQSRICSRHCEDLRRKIHSYPDGDICECHSEEAVRVNASVVFTANPSREAKEIQVEAPTPSKPMLVQLEEAMAPLKSMVATKSVVETCNNGKESSVVMSKLEQFQHTRSGLIALAASLPQRDTACLSIRTFQNYGKASRSSPYGYEETIPSGLSRQQEKPEHLTRTLCNAPSVASTQYLAGQNSSNAAPYSESGKEKLDEQFTSVHSKEGTGNKRVRDDATSGGAMAARLAMRIRHALEGISGKADTCRTILFSEPQRQIAQHDCTPKTSFMDNHLGLKRLETAGGTVGLETSQLGGFLQRLDNLSKVSNNASGGSVRSSQRHIQTIPRIDADMYLHDVLAALSTGENASSDIHKSCTIQEESPTSNSGRHQGVRPGTGRINASCSERNRHVSYNSASIEDMVKEHVDHVGSENMKDDKHRLQVKLQNATEAAKRLYSDLINYANNSKDPVGQGDEDQGEDCMGDVAKFARPFHEAGCPVAMNSMKKAERSISRGHCEDADQKTSKVGTWSTHKGVKGQFRVCPVQYKVERETPGSVGHAAGRPYFDFRRCGTSEIEQPVEEAEMEPLDEITIEFSDDPDVQTNIMVLQNDSIEQCGYNVEITTPYKSPRQKQSKKGSQADCVVKQGTASWKGGSKPTTQRIGPHGTGTNYRNKRNPKIPLRSCIECVQEPLDAGRRHERCPKPPSIIESNIRQEGSKGVNSGHKKSAGESSCAIHPNGKRGPTPRKIQGNSARETSQDVQRDHRKKLDDRCPRNGQVKEGIEPGETCADLLSGRCIHGVPEVDQINEARDHSGRRRIHDDLACSSRGRSGEIIGHKGTRLEEQPHLSSPLENHNRLLRDCSRIRGGETYQYTLPATEVTSKDPSLSARGTRQSSTRESNANASAHIEANTQTTPPCPSSLCGHVNRAAAAAGLAKEIEVMIADVISKPRTYLKNRGSKRMPQFKPPYPSEEQNEPYRQTKLDGAVVAAAKAVNKLKIIPLISPLEENEGCQKATPRKGRAPSVKVVREDIVGGGFYDQMHQELKELKSERINLLQQERARFQTQFLLFPSKLHKEADIPIKGRSSGLRNLSAVYSYEEEEWTKSIREMRKSQGLPSVYSGINILHTPGSKRQRSATSPAREHGNKLLRLSAGKAEAQPDKRRQGHNLVCSSLFTKAVGNRYQDPDKLHMKSFNPLEWDLSKKNRHIIKDNEVQFNRGLSAPYRSTSFQIAGRWKHPTEQRKASNTTSKETLSKQKLKMPAWVDRMSQAKHMYSIFLKPLLVENAREEHHLKPSVRRRNLRPPGFMFRSSILGQQMSENLTGAKAFSLVDSTPDKNLVKRSTASNKYDTATGRRIHPGPIPEAKPEQRAKPQKTKGITRSFYKKTSGSIRHSIMKHNCESQALINPGDISIRSKGWNADPLIVSDTPYKASDIVRYNRGSSRQVQVHKHNGSREQKIVPGKAREQTKLRHVTFAAMEVQVEVNHGNSRKGLKAPRSCGHNKIHVASGKSGLLQQLKRLRIGKRKAIGSSGSKRAPVRDKDGGLRHGGEKGKHWVFGEEFWTGMFNPELGKALHSDSIHSLVTSGQILSPIVLSENAHQNGKDFIEGRTQQEDELTWESGLHVKSSFDREKKELESAVSAEVEHEAEAASYLKLVFESKVNKNAQGVLKSLVKADSTSQINCLLRVADSGLSDLEHDKNVEHSTSEVTVELVRFEYMDAGEEPHEDTSLRGQSTMSITQVRASNVGSDDHDDKEQLGGDQFPQSPLILLNDMLPVSTEHKEDYGLFDCFCDSTVQIETQLQEPGSSSLSFTRQTFIDLTAENNEAKQLEDIELEQTLLDILLHTILQDDPVQDLQTPSRRPKPSPSPGSRGTNFSGQADKEAEVWVPSGDVSQLHLPTVAPYVDKATEPGNLSFSPQDQECQTMESNLLSQSWQRPLSQAHAVLNTEIHDVQQHQATQVHWNHVRVQAMDANGSILPLGPPAAIPMFMPLYFPHYGPLVVPSVHIATPLHTTPSDLSARSTSLSAINQSTQTAVNHGSQASVLQSPLDLDEIEAKTLPRRPQSSRRSTAGKGQVNPLNIDSESEWDALKRSSSLLTPSTPLSSPGHDYKLKSAMELLPSHSCDVQATSAVTDHAERTSLVCHQNTDSDHHAQQIEGDKRPELEESKLEEVDKMSEGPPPLLHQKKMNCDRGTRRGTSWAKVKEMEEAALLLLRTVLQETPPSPSSSDYSCDTSPGLCTILSPGEVVIEGAQVGGSHSSGEISCTYDTHTLAEHFGRQLSSIRVPGHALGPFGMKRASIGEISNPIHLFGPLSEGEIEAGAVPSVGEAGQIHNEASTYGFDSYSSGDVRGGRSEPGELSAEPVHI